MFDESEKLTRKKRIDARLKSMTPPWKIIRYQDGLDCSCLHGVAVEEYPTDSGPADYALFVNGKILGIIEAKKVALDPYNVLEQAKRYSRGIHNNAGKWGEYGVPFLYSTNGETIWFIDIRDDRAMSRRLANYHNIHALEEMFSHSTRNDWFANNPVNIQGIRNYQREAIEAVEDGITRGQRSFLVAMATGTGKTFTTVAQIYRLLKSTVAKRILFLVDRRALAAQAVMAFASFQTQHGNKFNQEYEVFHQQFRREDLEDSDNQTFDPKVLPGSYLTSPKESQTFVYVSTIQRMAINLYGPQYSFAQNANDPDLEEDANILDIPISAFDVIIADECHRGYTSQELGIWRQVMDHFDALKIGLTATPASHTVNLFGEPVYRYTTEEAIADGYLVDYDAVRIHSDVRMNGVFLREGDNVGVVNPETGTLFQDRLEDERQFDTSDIESRITAPDSNRRIMQEIAGYALRHEEETGRFPKMLIFAANDLPHTSHADQLVQQCRDIFKRGDEFVQKITGSPTVDRPLQRIREFRNRPNPKIVVTVDMLSTGVDIPALEFIVFLRPVKSRILWTQMLGRGTRLCTDINKTNFTVFDCFDGTLIEYFRNATDFQITLPPKDPLGIVQVIENIYQNVEREYHIRVLQKRLRRISRDMSGNARIAFAQWGISDGNMELFANELPGRLDRNFIDTMNLLRNSDFQKLLVNYERAPRSFWIANDIQDNVVSERIFRVGDNTLKPEDYLTAFSRFVNEKRDEIDGLQVLLKRPAGWRPEVLDDLRIKLGMQGFPESALRDAHSEVYHIALADIISMVKHAAREEEPLLTAEQRVDKAMQQVTTGKTFSSEQQAWLGYIREHLVENLTIDINDLNLIPVFEQHGGLGRAQRVFQPDVLQWLIEELNEAVAV
ncbi:MAG: type I restriction-modification enzyme R subunit C-terminal domain-containing protein [bacterium]